MTATARPWRAVAAAYLGGSVAVIAAAVIAGQPHAASVGLALLSAVTVLAGAHLHRPSRSWPWHLLAAALALFAAGGVVREAFGTLGDVSAARPLAGDATIVVGYLLLVAAVAGVNHRRGATGALLDSLSDAAVVALSAFAASWVLWIEPLLVGADAAPGAQIALVAYPLTSVFVVAVVARTAATTLARRVAASWLLLAGGAALLAGDVVYLVAELHPSLAHAAWLSTPYSIALAGASLAALHPTMAQEPPAPPPARRGRLLLVVSALGVPGVVAVVAAEVTDGGRVALIGSVAALAGLVAVRLYRAERSRAALLDDLSHRATHDQLTGLPNRSELHRRLGHLLARRFGDVAVAFVDLDRFKNVNDALGHSAGDDLLRDVAARLSAATGDDETVARFGGDEFAVILVGAGDDEAALSRGADFRTLFDTPFAAGGAHVHTDSSVGVARARASDTPDDLLRRADIALYHAKTSGRGRAALYDDGMAERARRWLAVESALRGAADRGELRLAYQPLIDLATGEARGTEALLRWHHPDLGDVSPGEFVPVAEDTGKAHELGAWVLEDAARTAATWLRDDVHAALPVAVNISPIQLASGDLADDVRDVLDRHQLPASALQIEITERALVHDPDAACAALRRLSRLGVTIALDDFGTGYSSLAYLKRYPVDIVKIDRAFLADAANDPTSASLVAAIQAMADSLDMRTVAEGVERVDQADLVTRIGCTHAQGFLYARPMPAADVPEAIDRIASGYPQAVG